jgi:cation:H+ antiporter
MALLYLVLGLVGLSLGADLAVRGSVAIAHRLGWPTWISGLLLLALGTSLPELFVSAVSAPEHPGLAVANIFGSNSFNSLVVLGTVLLLKKRQRLDVHAVRLPTLIPLVIGSALAFFLLTMPFEWYRVSAILMVGYLAMILLSFAGREAKGEDEVAGTDVWKLPLAVSAALAGFVVLTVSARGFLTGALGVADWMGWNEGVTGYILAAVGTSAPELFTSIRALRLGHAEALFGNVVGSNAFNLLLAGGTIGLLAGQEVPTTGLAPQLWMNAVATAVLLVPALLLRPGKLVPQRWERIAGAGLLLLYVVSAGWVFLALGLE